MCCVVKHRNRVPATFTKVSFVSHFFPYIQKKKEKEKRKKKKEEGETVNRLPGQVDWRGLKSEQILARWGQGAAPFYIHRFYKRDSFRMISNQCIF